MNPEEIKVGEICYVRVKVDSKDSESVYCQLIDADGNCRKALSFYNWMLYAFLPVHPAPKYDPCRRFKKGDKVEYSPRDGRDCLESPWIYDAAEVIEDEDKNGSVVVRFTFNYGEPAVHKVPWYHLQLVTPVEELEPYFVMELKGAYCVYNTRFQPETEVCHFFADMHPHAKEAAEAECARLNEEHRKDQK